MIALEGIGGGAIPRYRRSYVDHSGLIPDWPKTGTEADLSTAVEPRFRKRIPCHLELAGGRYSGMVLNLSRQGLFVQTTAAAQPGQPIALNLNLNGEAMPLRAAVRWKRIVAPHLRTVETGGIGLRIHRAPESYYQFLSGVADGPGTGPLIEIVTETRTESETRPAEVHAAPLTYKVWVKETTSPRSRVVRVQAADENTAKQRALTKVGSDWYVLQIDEV